MKHFVTTRLNAVYFGWNVSNSWKQDCKDSCKTYCGRWVSPGFRHLMSGLQHLGAEHLIISLCTAVRHYSSQHFLYETFYLKLLAYQVQALLWHLHSQSNTNSQDMISTTMTAAWPHNQTGR